VTEAEGATDAREHGWWRPLLALIALLLFPATPLLRIVFPVDQTILLLAPALAILAVAGWRAGGRLPLAVMWSVFAVWVLWQPGSDPTSFALLARGWAAILAATFGALTMAGVGDRFLPRALMTLAIALGLSALVAVVASGGVTHAVEVFNGEIARRAAASLAQWREMTSSVEWMDLTTARPDAKVLADQVDRQLASLPGVASLAYTALLALESLAALALAWAVYHRVGRVRLGPPLARLRDLRFDDALVWGIVAGLVIVVLPLVGPVRAAGVNLLVFFGALYALRGMGVMVWFLAPGRWMMAFLVIFTLLFWHVVGLVAVAIGLGDTWFDWRRRSRPKTQRSE
jgi:hypothetical protein